MRKTVDSLKYMLKFKEIALKNREDMLKRFIEENKSLRETLKSLQKPANLSFSLTKSSEITAISSKNLNENEKPQFFETQRERENERFSLKKQPTSLRRNATISDKLRKNKELSINISKGLFTTSRNLVKMSSTSLNFCLIKNYLKKMLSQ